MLVGALILIIGMVIGYLAAWVQFRRGAVQAALEEIQVTLGKTQFIESVSDKERFKQAKNITDLLN